MRSGYIKKTIKAKQNRSVGYYSLCDDCEWGRGSVFRSLMGMGGGAACGCSALNVPVSLTCICVLDPNCWLT